MKWFEYGLTIWIIITLNFLLPRLLPGDPFLIISSDSAQDEEIVLTQEQQDYYKSYYGLDKSMGEQYVAYIGQLAHGDLGYSIYYKEPVSQIIFRRLGWTTFIVVSALVISTGIGVILGSISAWYREKWPDKLLFFQMILLSEIPVFLVGLIILFVFSAWLRLFPLSGAMTHFEDYNSWWDKLFDILNHAFLPIVVLSISQLGGIYLLVRNSMTTVLEKDYLRTAKAKGLNQRRIIFHHALRNALLPVVTRIFLSLGALVGGAILVENVFSYPGLGRLMRECIKVHDYQVVQGIFLVVTIFVLLANFLADTVYKKLDPRVKDCATSQGG
ncbi:ABC transporter permease [Acetobacterium woodii]|uniref:Gluthation ABC transport system permease protein GsiC n=1 Tax=Acetobacterium woodii (strain ATCC 29683 / DSM 1030 / JCM 2381 / KCTC 1655 / WB1) TaxID=931626 RepID=H6LIB8_ACEWD|nr:ABC transporter permease [Acetobacterium woodii]AFA47292.1 gluthation ABC transport system permease protein GsiC [Acetobacterium woodii DSM 1030]